MSNDVVSIDPNQDEAVGREGSAPRSVCQSRATVDFRAIPRYGWGVMCHNLKNIGKLSLLCLPLPSLWLRCCGWRVLVSGPGERSPAASCWVIWTPTTETPRVIVYRRGQHLEGS